MLKNKIQIPTKPPIVFPFKDSKGAEVYLTLKSTELVQNLSCFELIQKLVLAQLFLN
jgi:hypothetical protein